jgi:hypothetical protein
LTFLLGSVEERGLILDDFGNDMLLLLGALALTLLIFGLFQRSAFGWR